MCANPKAENSDAHASLFIRFKLAGLDAADGGMQSTELTNHR